MEPIMYWWQLPGRRCSTARMWSLTLWLGVIALVPAKAQNTILPAYLADVARYNAPFIIAEVSKRNTDTRLEQVLALDFDGNTSTWDQFLNASCTSTCPPLDTRPTVYFSITETGGPGSGYYFIGYYFYHPYDSGFAVDVFGVDGGHESDLEGIFLVIDKNPIYGPYGLPLMALTESHGNLLPFGSSVNSDSVLNFALATGDIHA